jgi:hypothetical protein
LAITLEAANCRNAEAKAKITLVIMPLWCNYKDDQNVHNTKVSSISTDQVILTDNVILRQTLSQETMSQVLFILSYCQLLSR